MEAELAANTAAMLALVQCLNHGISFFIGGFTAIAFSISSSW